MSLSLSYSYLYVSFCAVYFASDSRLKETIAEELQVDESLQPASKDSGELGIHTCDVGTF